MSLMRINKSEALRGWRAPFHKNLPFPHGQAIALAAPHFLDHHAAGSISIVVAGAPAAARFWRTGKSSACLHLAIRNGR
jgi:hypothetical protein